MPYPYTNGDVLNATDMNAVGLHLITPSSVTNGTLSGATVTIGSAVSSVTVNGVFSADFDNYRLVVTGAAYSVSNTTVMFRPSNATTAYYGLMDVDLWTGATSTDYYNNGSFLGIGLTTTVAGASVSSTDIFQPFATLRTLIAGQHYGNGYMGRHIGNHNVDQSHTSFTIAPNSGTMTGGTIRVYGYSNG